jgi:hypothetical protein
VPNPKTEANPERANSARSHNTATRMAQDEPGGRRAGFALQAPWSGRRAPSRLAAGDESPMNFQETHVL